MEEEVEEKKEEEEGKEEEEEEELFLIPRAPGSCHHLTGRLEKSTSH